MVKRAAARLTMSSREPDARGKAPLRRRVPRVATGAWPGRYVDDQDPGSGPRECFVIDISLLGVGSRSWGTSERTRSDTGSKSTSRRRWAIR